MMIKSIFSKGLWKNLKKCYVKKKKNRKTEKVLKIDNWARIDFSNIDFSSIDFSDIDFSEFNLNINPNRI